MLFGVVGYPYGEMEVGLSVTPRAKNHFHVGWKEERETVKLLEDTTEYVYDLRVKEKKIS